jgi:CDP-diacylglycerol---serine O-phosphatidyltransferase
LINKQNRRRQIYSLQRLLPNMVTIASLCAGMTSIRFALAERFDWAVLTIVLAAILDNLDGRMARLVGGGSKFGAELDSLSDFISFGAAPCILLYVWSLQTIGNIGWVAILFYVMCGGLRLAKFNIEHGNPDERPSSFFIGIPIPAASGLIMMPIIVSYAFDIDLSGLPYLAAAILIIVGAGMVSRFHAYSFKRIRIPSKYVLLSLIIMVIFVALIATFPWLALIGIELLFVGTIPLSMREAKRMKESKQTTKKSD